MSECLTKCAVSGMRTLPVSTGVDQKLSIKFQFLNLSIDKLVETICVIRGDAGYSHQLEESIEYVGADRFVLGLGVRRDINFIGRMDPTINDDGDEVKGAEMSIPFRGFISKAIVARKYDSDSEDFFYTVTIDCEKSIDSRLDGELAYFLGRKLKRNKVTYDIFINEYEADVAEDEDADADC